ncbi:MAG: flavodoxin-dependent (E)-4-hydroxy-3-methylbut-2-enyl-diphosphate synthase [Endomicrobium sp.]|jgi:(E)-4-hydroxy-3-methylbut-2-enyl-diphosphate synthase|nr:flavodoxin-dependent (E)-4-hydroxy-3-methylbut-2-enyl-diphosphate synthase [Endomicrobium sp.]
MFYTRFNTKRINVGDVCIGGGSPISIQSMTNTNSKDAKSTIKQIKQLEDIGCEIVRVSFPDFESVCNIHKIKKNINIPLVADIHFDYNIALEAIKQGVDKIRINPCNIGPDEIFCTLAKEAKNANIPIRIGINSGSLKMSNIQRDEIRAEIIVNTAIRYINLLEDNNFENIIVSLKTSDVYTTVEAYKLFAEKKSYPLHLGITESGSIFTGTIKSSVGLGIILYNNLGDTLRVSLTADPIEEVKVANYLLRSMNLRRLGPEIISCPTCSRCKFDLIKIVSEFEKEVFDIKNFKRLFKPVKIAIMGCVVNGPGEAKNADFGIAGGEKFGVLFKNGKVIEKVENSEWIKKLIYIIEHY